MKITLTKHENETFESQTIRLAGHAYFNCMFKRCTLIFTNTACALNNCHFDSCHWRIEYDVLWCEQNTVTPLKRLLEVIEAGMKGEKTRDFSTQVH